MPLKTMRLIVVFAYYVIGRDDRGKRITMGEALRRAKNDLLTLQEELQRHRQFDQ